MAFGWGVWRMRYILHNTLEGYYTGRKRRNHIWTTDITRAKLYGRKGHAASAATLMYDTAKTCEGYREDFNIRSGCFEIEEVRIELTGQKWWK